MRADQDIIETEQYLLGCCLHVNTAVLAVMDTGLNGADFISHEHGLIFERMRTLFTERQSFAVSDMAPVTGAFPNGMDARLYVRTCADAVPCPTEGQARLYAQSLKEAARKRNLAAALSAAQKLLEQHSSTDVLARIGDLMAENAPAEEIKSGTDIHTEILADMTLPPNYWPTGLPVLDRSMAGGLYAGFVYGLAGREKAGKTTLAGTISFNLNRAGCPHLYVALEMGSKEIEKRNLSRRLQENSIRFQRPGQDLRARAKAAEPSRNIYYLDAPGASLEDILRAIGTARIRYGIKGFILDYWQLVEGRERGETEEQHIRRVAQSIANYAKRNGLWCIMLAQMNKDGDLFGGGGLRKACEQLYFIETPDKPGMESFRWLRMAASRYTPQADVGSAENPAFALNHKIGPHFVEAYAT